SLGARSCAGDGGEGGGGRRSGECPPVTTRTKAVVAVFYVYTPELLFLRAGSLTCVPPEKNTTHAQDRQQRRTRTTLREGHPVRRSEHDQRRTRQTHTQLGSRCAACLPRVTHEVNTQASAKQPPGPPIGHDTAGPPRAARPPLPPSPEPPLQANHVARDTFLHGAEESLLSSEGQRSPEDTPRTQSPSPPPPPSPPSPAHDLAPKLFTPSKLKFNSSSQPGADSMNLSDLPTFMPFSHRFGLVPLTALRLRSAQPKDNVPSATGLGSATLPANPDARAYLCSVLPSTSPFSKLAPPGAGLPRSPARSPLPPSRHAHQLPCVSPSLPHSPFSPIAPAPASQAPPPIATQNRVTPTVVSLPASYKGGMPAIFQAPSYESSQSLPPSSPSQASCSQVFYGADAVAETLAQTSLLSSQSSQVSISRSQAATQSQSLSQIQTQSLNLNQTRSQTHLPKPILKKAAPPPRPSSRSTDEDIQGSKDALIQDLEKKLRSKEARRRSNQGVSISRSQAATQSQSLSQIQTQSLNLNQTRSQTQSSGLPQIQLPAHGQPNGMSKVGGLPSPDVSWYLDGKAIRPDDYHKMLVCEKGMHSFIIEIVTVHHAGVYECVAHNRAGESRFTMRLDVIAAQELLRPPSFTQKMQNSRAQEGDTVRMECKVDASPPPQLFWKKDKDMLRVDPNRMSLYQDGSGRQCLLIERLTKADAGWYTLSAINEAGMSTCNARLDVSTRTTPAMKMAPPGSKTLKLLTSLSHLAPPTAAPPTQRTAPAAQHTAPLYESEEL
ncbi:hypothetical protein CRUP_024934, partial [Coryphaenoides rupestris]